MYLRYRDVIEDPTGNAGRIVRFLGRRLDEAAMAGAVDGTLYRERHEPSKAGYGHRYRRAWTPRAP